MYNDDLEPPVRLLLLKVGVLSIMDLLHPDNLAMILQRDK